MKRLNRQVSETCGPILGRLDEGSDWMILLQVPDLLPQSATLVLSMRYSFTHVFLSIGSVSQHDYRARTPRVTTLSLPWLVADLDYGDGLMGVSRTGGALTGLVSWVYH